MRRVPTRLLFLSFLVCASHADAHEGWGLIVRPDGTIYFADIPTNTIWRVTPDGRLEIAVSDKHSHALVGMEDGRIYGTHEHTRDRPGEVWRLSPDGELLVVFTASDAFEMSLHPFLIAADGTIYSTNVYAGPNGPHRLLRRSPSGSMNLAVADARGIDGLAFGPNGSIYFTDTTRLRRLSADGTVTTIADSLTDPSWGEDLMGLAVESATSIYVADYSGHRVVHVNGAGRPTPIFSSSWPWSPTGVVRQGTSMFVLEHLRMPFVLLGNLGVGPYIRVLRVANNGTTEARVVVVWGRYSWVVGVIGFAVVVAVAAAIVLRRRIRKPRISMDRKIVEPDKRARSNHPRQ
jgi:sugar lactone lactonase YvrE